MPGGIFLLDPARELTEMAETATYVRENRAEIDFQQLLARHPDLLAGDQIDPGKPRRWLLVSREVGISDQEQSGARWALDHLFLDQGRVPTHTPREVVGQMLDYAANSVLYWTADAFQTWLAKRCEREGLDPEQQLTVLLDGASSSGDFWQRVKTNLQAGKVRLLFFVSDAIPPELRRIVEFLNEQMDPAEVLAVEIRQYAGGDLRTLIPRVMGQTSESLTKKTNGTRETRQWDEPTFLADLTRRTGEAEAQVARRILDWAKDQGCRIWWGKGAQAGSFFPMVRHGDEESWTISVWTYGRVEIQFQQIRTRPRFDASAKRSSIP